MVCVLFIARWLIIRAKRREVPWEKNNKFYVADDYDPRRGDKADALPKFKAALTKKLKADEWKLDFKPPNQEMRY